MSHAGIMPRGRDRIDPGEILLLLGAVACVALLVFGIVAASLSHTPPTN